MFFCNFSVGQRIAKYKMIIPAYNKNVIKNKKYLNAREWK